MNEKCKMKNPAATAVGVLAGLKIRAIYSIFYNFFFYLKVSEWPKLQYVCRLKWLKTTTTTLTHFYLFIYLFLTNYYLPSSTIYNFKKLLKRLSENKEWQKSKNALLNIFSWLKIFNGWQYTKYFFWIIQHRSWGCVLTLCYMVPSGNIMLQL